VNKPEDEQVRGRTSQRTHRSRCGCKSARRRMSQEANKPEGE